MAMALPLACSPTVSIQTHLSRKPNCGLYPLHFNSAVKISVQCISSAQSVEPEPIQESKYWDYEHMMSLTSEYTDDRYKMRLKELKTKVRELLADSGGVLTKLEMIDLIEKLGIGYHFEKEIKHILELALIEDISPHLNDNLYATALQFRLLRQHGYHVPQEVFKSFKDEMGNFRSTLGEDVKGMLSLYEASYLSFESENMMDEAKVFTTKYLKNPNRGMSPAIAKMISRSLEVPLHCRAPRIEARWYIDLYETEEVMEPALVEMAKLDYNMVQAVHQRELGNLARWWMDLDLQKRLSFARDKLMVHYIWFALIIPDPQFRNCREILTKFIFLLTVIDDMYDSHASLEELQLFTNAIERWDIKAIEGLPQYMKIIYMALLNTTYQASYEVLKEHGYDVSSFQKKAWVQNIKAFMVEAKWEKRRIKPPAKEFMDIGVQSIGVLLSHMHCYILTASEITQQAIKCIEADHELLYCPAVILRLSDDLSAPQLEMKCNAIETCMREQGISEDDAREHIKKRISETWKKMNKANVDSHPFEEPFTSSTFNMCRLAESFMVSGDDGHEAMSMIVEPIPYAKI